MLRRLLEGSSNPSIPTTLPFQRSRYSSRRLRVAAAAAPAATTPVSANCGNRGIGCVIRLSERCGALRAVGLRGLVRIIRRVAARIASSRASLGTRTSSGVESFTVTVRGSTPLSSPSAVPSLTAVKTKSNVLLVSAAPIALFSSARCFVSTFTA